MKSYRTIVTPDKPGYQISHRDRLVSIGSCFSENIGKKFSEYKFAVNINPFGQQYNPYSIAQAINRLLTPIPYTENELIFHDSLYHSFDHHGDFSGTDRSETLQTINNNLAVSAQDLRKATVVFLTFGSAHIFSTITDGRIVSNCHKLSGSNFQKRLLAPQEIVDVLSDTLESLRRVNPDVKVVVTVSPVRYFAFGHYENSVSKGHLFTAIHQLIGSLPDIYYFPAYELVIDDLRDYRFFSEDMLHPNYQATAYVWENLCNATMSKETLEIMRELDEILAAAKHRPRNPLSEAHQKFVTKYTEKAKALEQKYQLSFEAERNLLQKTVVNR